MGADIISKRPLKARASLFSRSQKELHVLERIAESKDVAEHKLLILYILSKLKISIASIELTNYILEERLMSFITFQQRIHELIATNHIRSDAVDGSTKYMITGNGTDLISKMTDLLPLTEKHRVDRTIPILYRRAINARSVKAVYVPEDENRGVVRIELSEGELLLLRLEVATASKQEARMICDNWKSRAADIYARILEQLLNHPQDGEAPPIPATAPTKAPAPTQAQISTPTTTLMPISKPKEHE